MHELNLIVDEINLKGALEFCSNVTKVLLLNKGKEAFVKVELIMDEQLNNLKILSDEFRLKLILLNFLSNSVKFTRSGSIKIKAKIVKRTP